MKKAASKWKVKKDTKTKKDEIANQSGPHGYKKASFNFPLIAWAAHS